MAVAAGGAPADLLFSVCVIRVRDSSWRGLRAAVAAIEAKCGHPLIFVGEVKEVLMST